jgi:hypothetical protein
MAAPEARWLRLGPAPVVGALASFGAGASRGCVGSVATTPPSLPIFMGRGVGIRHDSSFGARTCARKVCHWLRFVPQHAPAGFTTGFVWRHVAWLPHGRRFTIACSENQGAASAILPKPRILGFVWGNRPSRPADGGFSWGWATLPRVMMVRLGTQSDPPRPVAKVQHSVRSWRRHHRRPPRRRARTA